MNILITGAHGFIGQKLTAKLSKQHKVYQLINSGKYEKNKLKIYCNLTKTKHIHKLLNENLKIDCVVHLASKMASPSNANELELLTENIIIYNNLLKIVSKFKVKQVINLSSIAVYPNKNGKYSETSVLDPYDNSDALYGVSKLCGENILNILCKDIKIIHLRVAQVYGKNMRNDRIIPSLQKELQRDNTITLFNNGERIISLISIKSLVKVIKFFIGSNHIGIYNISSKSVSLNDIAEEIILKNGNKHTRINYVSKGTAVKQYIDTEKFKRIYKGKLC